MLNATIPYELSILASRKYFPVAIPINTLMYPLNSTSWLNNFSMIAALKSAICPSSLCCLESRNCNIAVSGTPRTPPYWKTIKKSWSANDDIETRSCHNSWTSRAMPSVRRKKEGYLPFLKTLEDNLLFVDKNLKNWLTYFLFTRIDYSLFELWHKDCHKHSSFVWFLLIVVIHTLIIT